MPGDARFPIARRALHDRGRARLWWTVGVVAYVGVILAVYPSVRNMAGMDEIMKSYPKELLALFSGGRDQIDFTQASGYLGTELYGWLVPLLAVVLAVSFGSSTLAGEEERGVLDLVLSYPVRRRAVVLQKAAVLAVEVAVLCATIDLAVGVGGRAVKATIELGPLLSSWAARVLLGVCFGSIALAVGAWRGHRGMAIGVASGLAAGTYLLNALGLLVSGLRPLRWASPFWYATGGDVLRDGVGAGSLAALVALDVVLVVTAVVAFERRELGT